MARKLRRRRRVVNRLLEQAKSERDGHRHGRQTRSKRGDAFVGTAAADPAQTGKSSDEGVVARARVDDTDQDLRNLDETSCSGPSDHADLDAGEAAKGDPRSTEQAQLVESIASFGQARPRDGAQPFFGAKLL